MLCGTLGRPGLQRGERDGRRFVIPLASQSDGCVVGQEQLGDQYRHRLRLLVVAKASWAGQGRAGQLAAGRQAGECAVDRVGSLARG